MEVTFYLCGLVAVLATLRVITHTDPVHALLYLIISLIALAGVFFSLGAYFAGALEIIIYAGAIMVLFVFIVMTLNMERKEIEEERRWLQQPSIWISPFVLSLLLLVVLVYAICSTNNKGIGATMIDAKAVGISLFSSYILVVELASMLLLAGLVVAFHIGREHCNTSGNLLNHCSTDNTKTNKKDYV